MENKENVVQNDAQAEAAKRRAKAIRQNKLISAVPFIACAGLCILYVVCALIKGVRLDLGFNAVITKATLVGLVATGATFIFTSGSFDLSLGSNMLLSALLGGLVCINTNGNLVLMLLTCIGVSILLSVLNSTLASTFNLPVFIMTIVMMSVYSSVASLIISTLGANSKIDIPLEYVSSLNTTWFRFLLLIVFEVFCCFIFYILKLGRRQKFLGGNPQCAYLSGVKAKSVTIISFALAGVGIGLAAFSMCVQTPTLSSTSGSSVGMNMLIALVFGGMSMSGGPSSKMYSALLGAFSMAFLDQFMNLFVTGDWYLQIVKAVLFVLVVYLVKIGNKNKMLER